MGCVYLASQTASETSGFVWGDCHCSAGSVPCLILDAAAAQWVLNPVRLSRADVFMFTCMCPAVRCWWQELLHRTSLENQKLSLMGEVSYLKIKLADMEGKQSHGAERQHKAEVRLPVTCGQRGFVFNVQHGVQSLSCARTFIKLTCVSQDRAALKSRTSWTWNWIYHLSFQGFSCQTIQSDDNFLHISSLYALEFFQICKYQADLAVCFIESCLQGGGISSAEIPRNFLSSLFCLRFLGNLKLALPGMTRVHTKICLVFWWI